jgi:NTE family protein
VIRAFVLSGGASLGAIQAGMLAALYERRIGPDLIVGASVGAINGAFIASRPVSTETADALAEVWTSLRRGDVFPLNPLAGLLGFLGRDSNLVPGGSLRRLIARPSSSTVSRTRRCRSTSSPPTWPTAVSFASREDRWSTR